MKALLKAVVILLLFITGTLFHAGAQTVNSSKTEPSGTAPTSAPDLDLAISATQPWTDTGLELHPGDVVERSSSSLSPGAAVGSGQPSGSCDANPTIADSSNNLQL